VGKGLGKAVEGKREERAKGRGGYEAYRPTTVVFSLLMATLRSNT
jgi:hypothetical protein